MTNPRDITQGVSARSRALLSGQSGEFQVVKDVLEGES